MTGEPVLKRFDHPDEVHRFPHGRFEILRLGGCRWVVGDEPYVSLHVLGAEHYTR